jgi:hypothetical protein
MATNLTNDVVMMMVRKVITHGITCPNRGDISTLDHCI